MLSKMIFAEERPGVRRLFSAAGVIVAFEVLRTSVRLAAEYTSDAAILAWAVGSTSVAP